MKIKKVQEYISKYIILDSTGDFLAVKNEICLNEELDDYKIAEEELSSLASTAASLSVKELLEVNTAQRNLKILSSKVEQRRNQASREKLFRENENKILTFIPSYELKRIKLKYRVTKDPDDLMKMQKETKRMEEEINCLIESYQKSREEYQSTCDNLLTHDDMTDRRVISGLYEGIQSRRVNIFIDNPSVQSRISQILQEIYEDTTSPPSSTCTTGAPVEEKIEAADKIIIKLLENSNSKCPVDLTKRTISKAEEILDELKKMKTSGSIEEDDVIERKLQELDESIEEAIRTSAENKVSSPQNAFDRAIERIPLPVFNGEHHLYFGWKRDHMSLNKYGAPNIQVLALKRSIKLAETREMVSNCNSLEEAFKILDRKYGNSRLIVPGIFSKLDKLESHPRDRKQEAENIQIIINGVNELKNHNALADFSDLCIKRYLNKIRYTTQKIWLRKTYHVDWSLEKLQDEFIKFLELEQELIFQEIQIEPLDSQRKGERSGNFTNSFQKVKININSTSAKSKCGLCDSDEHFLLNCPFLKDENAEKTLREKKICVRCLRDPCKGYDCGTFYSRFHEKQFSSDCKTCRARDTGKPINFKVCRCGKKPQQSSTINSNSMKATTSGKLGQGMPMTETIEVRRGMQRQSITIFYDTGANQTMGKARILEKFGTKVMKANVAVNLADSSTKYLNNANLYKLEITKAKDSIEVLGAAEMPSQKLFTFTLPQDWQRKYKVRAVGSEKSTVDIIMGTDNMQWFPKELERKGNITLFRSVITGNLIVGGKNAKGKARGEVQANRLCVSEKAEDLFMKNCSYENVDCIAKPAGLVKEKLIEYADREIRDNITFDETLKAYKVKLIYNAGIKNLSSNKEKVMKEQLRLQRKLSKSPELLEDVNKCLRENFDKEYWKWAKSPVKHCIPYSFVHNMNSSSTPIRLVINSSFRTPEGYSLNDCFDSGSNDIGDLKKILLNFRCREQSIVADISKFFYSFHLGEEDQAYHGLLIPVNKTTGVIGYGELDETEFWEAVQCRLAFGDTPSPNVATIGRKKWAVENSEDPRIINILTNNSFVDDIFGYCGYEEDANTVMKQLEEVATKGNFVIKEFFVSNQHPKNEDSKMVGNEEAKALGYKWLPFEDKLMLRNNFYLGKKQRGKATIALTMENMDEILKNLSKRNALSLLMQNYDILGLFSPLNLRLKLAYQQNLLNHPGQQWESELPEADKKQFIAGLKEILKLTGKGLSRTVVPKNYSGTPWMVGFCDGSGQAVGAVIYVRYKLQDGTYAANLLTSKTKISGLRNVSTPKAELLGCTLLINMMDYLLRNLEIHFERKIVLTDSTVVLGQIKKPSCMFDGQTGGRIDQIQQMEKEHNLEFYHVPGEQNVADMVTRQTSTVADVLSERWTQGGFLEQDFDTWPINKKIKLPEELPGLRVLPSPIRVNVLQLQENEQLPQLKEIFNIKKYRSFTFVKSVLARLLKWKFQTSDQLELLEKAERILIKDASIEVKNAYKDRKFSTYNIQEIDKVLYLVGRSTESQPAIKLLLLNQGSLMGRTILLEYHDRFHGYGVNFVASKIREYYYFPHINKTLRSILKNCYQCKRLMAKESSQLMSPQKDIRFQTMVPPFSNVMIDYAGPILGFDEVKRRTSKKFWFLLITCLSTRSLKVIVIPSMTTDNFIMGLRKHIAEHAAPENVYSDVGSNIAGGGKRLEEDQEINIEKLKIFTQKMGIKFIFGAPNHSAGQGAVERMVGLFKQALGAVKDKSQKLTFFEMSTFAEEAAALVNQRPMLYNPDPGEAVNCYELLTLRRNGNYLVDLGREDSLTKRSTLTREYVSAWWERFVAAYHKALTTYGTWKDKVKNLAVHDVVLILDKPSISNPWSLGVISGVKTSADDLVRKVFIKYKLPNSKNFKFLERSVHSISLLVPNQDDVIDPLEAVEKIPDEEEVDQPVQRKRLQVKIGVPLDVIQDL